MATLKQKVSGVAVSRTVIANYDDSTVVHNAGTETVAGVKTFTESPQVPNIADASDASMKVANTKFVKDVVSAAITSALDAIYPIGSYAFGVQPGVGTWEEVSTRGKYLHNIALRDSDTLMQFLTLISSDGEELNTLLKLCQALNASGHKSVITALQSSGHNAGAMTYSGAYSPNGTQLYCYKVKDGAWSASTWVAVNDKVTALIDYPVYKRTA